MNEFVKHDFLSYIQARACFCGSSVVFIPPPFHCHLEGIVDLLFYRIFIDHIACVVYSPHF